MGSREKLLAPGAEEIEHRLRRWQQDLVLAGEDEPLPDHGEATTSRVINRRSSSSVATVCAEMNAMPRPAITACLMVSLLLIAMPILGRTPCGLE